MCGEDCVKFIDELCVGYVCMEKRGYDTHSDLPNGTCVDTWLESYAILDAVVVRI